MGAAGTLSGTAVVVVQGGGQLLTGIAGVGGTFFRSSGKQNNWDDVTPPNAREMLKKANSGELVIQVVNPISHELEDLALDGKSFVLTTAGLNIGSRYVPPGAAWKFSNEHKLEVALAYNIDTKSYILTRGGPRAVIFQSTSPNNRTINMYHTHPWHLGDDRMNTLIPSASDLGIVKELIEINSSFVVGVDATLVRFHGTDILDYSGNPYVFYDRSRMTFIEQLGETWGDIEDYIDRWPEELSDWIEYMDRR